MEHMTKNFLFTMFPSNAHRHHDICVKDPFANSVFYDIDPLNCENVNTCHQSSYSLGDNKTW